MIEFVEEELKTGSSPGAAAGLAPANPLETLGVAKAIRRRPLGDLKECDLTISTSYLSIRVTFVGPDS